MRLDRQYQFSGEAGRHRNKDFQVCAGRMFQPRIVGRGGCYFNEVECTLCHQRLEAWEHGLIHSDKVRVIYSTSARNENGEPGEQTEEMFASVEHAKSFPLPNGYTFAYSRWKTATTFIQRH